MNNSIAEHPTPSQRFPAAGSLAGLLLRPFRLPRAVLWLVVVVDAVMVMLAFFCFYLVRVNSGLFSDLQGMPVFPVLMVMALAVAPWLLLFWFSGIYVAVHNRSFFDEFYSVLKVTLFGFAVLFVVVYLDAVSGTGAMESRRVISLLIYFALVIAAVGIGRSAVRRIVRRLRKLGFGLRRTLIIGDSAQSRQLLQMLAEGPELGYDVVGTIATPIGASDQFLRLAVGEVGQINQIIRDQNIEVTIFGMKHEHDMAMRLMIETAVADTSIKIIPDMYDIVSGQARAQHLYGVPLIEVNPQIMPVWAQRLKRAFDIIFSTLVLLLGLPLWLLLALLIWLEDHGPVIYSQQRVGFGGKAFMIHKFRSMRVDAEKFGITWAATNDPRVTRIGRFMRQSHLDEIPQFWNVLLGEMSIVGPRPERPFFVEKYTALLPSYPRRHRVKPGLTGWNQIQAEELVESIEIVSEKLRHDFFYIENMSLRLDFEIVLRTVIRILKRKGQT